MGNSGKILKLHYKYDKVGLDIESSLPTKNCSTFKLQSDKEKFALLDAYKRVVLDEPVCMGEDNIVGSPSLLTAEFENGSFQYEGDGFWFYNKTEPIKYITNKGVDLYTYTKNEKSMYEYDLKWNAVIYEKGMHDNKYRLIETYMRNLYQGVTVKYVECSDGIKITLDYESSIKQDEKDSIFLVFSMISELVFTNCNTFIMCKDIKGIVGVDIFRKLKRVINSQSNVVQCIFL